MPNAADRAAILAALASGDVAALEDRFVVFLASMHPHARAALPPASRTSRSPSIEFDETLPNRGARWVYRLRLADAAGHLSADGVDAARHRARSVDDRVGSAGSHRARRRRAVVLRVGGGSEVTDLLVFMRALDVAAPRRATEAELLRVASSAGAAARRACALRLPDGTLLAPSVKSLADRRRRARRPLARR